MWTSSQCPGQFVPLPGRRGLVVLILFIFLIGIRTGQAQSRQDLGSTEDEFIRMALERNADMLATRQRAAETQGLLRQAGLRPNPGIEFEFTDGSIVGSPGEREFSVSYAHTLELGGKLDRRVDVAEVGQELARFEILDKERLLRADVRLAYTAALAALRNLGTASQLVEVNEDSYRLIQMRIDEGESSTLEGGLLQVELNRLRTDRLRFESAVEMARSELQTLVSADPETRIDLAGTLETPSVRASLDGLVAQALAERPDLEAARIRERLAEAEIALADAEGVPNAVVFGRYARGTASFDQFGLSGSGIPVPLRDTDNTLTGGIAFNLPFSDRNQGNIEASLARRQSAELGRRYLERVVQNEVRVAYDRLRAAEQIVTLFDSQILNQAEANLATIRTAYEFGELRLLDVVAEQRRLIDTQQAYTTAIGEYRSAFVELERAVGGPLMDPTSLVEVTNDDK